MKTDEDYVHETAAQIQRTSPQCNEAKSLNITPCCISILIFLIHILIMMSFSFSPIPSKNGDDSLVQDIMLSCSNFTLLLLYFTCYSGAQMVVCLLVGVTSPVHSLLGDFMIFVMMN